MSTSESECVHTNGMEREMALGLRLVKTEPEPVEATDLDVLDHDLKQLKSVKDQIKTLEETKEILEKSVQERLVSLGKTRRRWVADNHQMTASLVEGRITINDDKLKKALGAALFNKVSKRVTDRTKLESFIATGEIDPTVVAQCSQQGRSYVRITTSPFKEDSDA